MNATPGRDKVGNKKAYVKPEVKRVDLKPEEAVLGGCKISGHSGPLQASCAAPVPCSLVVS
jgi:hypothetical protein